MEKFTKWISGLEPVARDAARIMIGLAYWTHGMQKSMGWFGGFMDGGRADLMTRWGAAGVIESVFGLLIVLGLFTRPAAFIAAGEMAVAYFWIHIPRDLWWWENRGEAVMIFSFFFLWVATVGAGRWSLDALLKKEN